MVVWGRQHHYSSSGNPYDLYKSRHIYPIRETDNIWMSCFLTGDLLQIIHEHDSSVCKRLNKHGSYIGCELGRGLNVYMGKLIWNHL